MFRLALLALGLTVAVLIVLSLFPQQQQVTPGGTITLSGAAVTLYPQADPDAVWNFAAKQVDYEPDVQETILHDIKDAERTVDGKTDFTLASQQLTIDAQENIIGQQIEVYLPDIGWALDMRARNGNPVLLDQEQGRFIAPAIDITDKARENISSSKNLSMNFDLTDVKTGGEGTRNRDSFRDTADQP